MIDIVMNDDGVWVPSPEKFAAICATFSSAFGEENCAYAVRGGALHIRLMKPGRCWLGQVPSSGDISSLLLEAENWRTSDTAPDQNIAAINWAMAASKRDARKAAS